MSTASSALLSCTFSISIFCRLTLAHDVCSENSLEKGLNQSYLNTVPFCIAILAVAEFYTLPHLITVWKWSVLCCPSDFTVNTILRSKHYFKIYFHIVFAYHHTPSSSILNSRKLPPLLYSYVIYYSFMQVHHVSPTDYSEFPGRFTFPPAFKYKATFIFFNPKLPGVKWSENISKYSARIYCSDNLLSKSRLSSSPGRQSF